MISLQYVVIFIVFHPEKNPWHCEGWMLRLWPRFSSPKANAELMVTAIWFIPITLVAFWPELTPPPTSTPSPSICTLLHPLITPTKCPSNNATHGEHPTCHFPCYIREADALTWSMWGFYESPVDVGAAMMDGLLFIAWRIWLRLGLAEVDRHISIWQG